MFWPTVNAALLCIALVLALLILCLDFAPGAVMGGA